MTRLLRWLLIIPAALVLMQQQLPAPILETETPSPAPKQTPQPKARRAEAPRTKASPTPTASSGHSLIQGTWVGTLHGVPGLGDVPITFVVNAAGTSEYESSIIGTFSRPTTWDGRTLTWLPFEHGGRSTMTVNPDGVTAVKESHSWYGHWSGLFRKTAP
jgi:hypothetical protein